MHGDGESKTGGPVVTISREKGCPANSIAQKLIDHLVRERKLKTWRRVDKDIIERTARDLSVNPVRINHVINSEDKGFFRDLMLSFGEKYSKSDVKIKKTIAGLVTEFSGKGKVIIVGLGGVAIARNIEKALHIKLYGPYKYRLREVMRMEKMKSDAAKEYMDETDLNRKMLIDYFYGFKAGDDLFHAHFNCALMTEGEIVSAIVKMMEMRSLI